jgi:NitT/TauT family transport system permease protein
MRRRDLALASLLLIAAWQLLAMAIHRDILPTPFVVLQTFVAELPRELARHFAVSAWRVLVSIAISIALAVPAGLVMGQSPRLNRSLAPLVYIVYPIPKIVFVPVLLLIFGIGDLSKIINIFLVLFFQILVPVRDEAARIRPELILSVRSLGAGRRALFRFVYLPACLPAVLTALRLSVGTAVAVLYITEVLATRSGLGYFITIQGSTLLNYPAMYAGALAMALLGLGLYFIVDRLERWLCPWRFVS